MCWIYGKRREYRQDVFGEVLIQGLLFIECEFCHAQDGVTLVTELADQ